MKDFNVIDLFHQHLTSNIDYQIREGMKHMDKPHWVLITDRAEIDALKEDLGGPMPIEDEKGVYCDADGLRAWREARLSTGEKHGG
jgi:hypothetical protein